MSVTPTPLADAPYAETVHAASNSATTGTAFRPATPAYSRARSTTT